LYETSGFEENAKIQLRYLGRGRTAGFDQLRVGPSPGRGLGLFAMQDTYADTFVTEYCGELKNEKDAKKMMDDGTDTHILGLSPMFVCIDGSIHGQFDMEWYCGGGGHRAGSFCNASLDGGQNCEYVILDIPDKHNHDQPYDWNICSKSWESTGYKKRAFIRTTKFVACGREYFCGYGRLYYGRHGLS
jgi:hypothetical protein